MKRIFHHLANPIIAAIGSAIAIAIISLVCIKVAAVFRLPIWIIAPICASAALVFAAPYSPFSQPLNVIMGNAISALSGIIAMAITNDIHLAASLAVGIAIGTMLLFRVLHPPGGGVALLVVLTHVSSPIFVIFPTMINSVILVICGILYHKLTHHHYPHIHSVSKSDAPAIKSVLKD